MNRKNNETIKYNENIEIIQYEDVENNSIKADNEFFALMVTDKKLSFDGRHFFDESKDWLGLEQCQNGIYICKSIDYPRGSVGMYGQSRGIPVIITVKDESKCVRLTHYEKDNK